MLLPLEWYELVKAPMRMRSTLSRPFTITTADILKLLRLSCPYKYCSFLEQLPNKTFCDDGQSSLSTLSNKIATNHIVIYRTSILTATTTYVLRHVWLCEHMNCSSPGSFVHGIFQVRMLEWVAISWSSWPRDQTCVSCIGRQILYHWTTWEAPVSLLGNHNSQHQTFSTVLFKNLRGRGYWTCFYLIRINEIIPFN